MNIKPAKSGRVLQGNTPWGDYSIHIARDHDGPVYDANGNQLGTVILAIKTPPPSPRGGIVRGVIHAAASVAKTSLGIDRASDEQIKARLDVCRACPGGHAIYRRDKLHTCGPMLQSMRDAGRGTCGCILRGKARDPAEDCPFGWWPKAK